MILIMTMPPLPKTQGKAKRFGGLGFIQKNKLLINVYSLDWLSFSRILIYTEQDKNHVTIIY